MESPGDGPPDRWQGWRKCGNNPRWCDQLATCTLRSLGGGTGAFAARPETKRDMCHYCAHTFEMDGHWEVFARWVKDDFAPNGSRYERLVPREVTEDPNKQHRKPLVKPPWLAYERELVAEEIGSYYATFAKPEETSKAVDSDIIFEFEQIVGDGEGSAAADHNDTDSRDYVMLGTDESEQDGGSRAGNAASQ